MTDLIKNSGLPFIVIVENKSSAFKKVSLFDEDYKDDDVKIYPGIPNSSYLKMIRLFQKHTIEIVSMFVFAKGHPDLYLKDFAASQYDANGTLYSMPIVLKRFIPLKDKVDTKCYCAKEYPISNLKLGLLSTLDFEAPPNSSIEIKLFPKNNLSLADNKELGHRGRMPYIFIIKNNSSDIKLVNLFENNDEHIEVVSASEWCTLSDLKNQLKISPFFSDKLELNVLSNNHEQSNGLKLYKWPIKSENEKTEDILRLIKDSDNKVYFHCENENFISEKSGIEVEVPGNMTIKVFIYPK